jgi:dihydroorotate dehydrogenase
MYPLARPLLFCLDAERAHTLGMAALETAYRTGLNPLLAVKPKPLPTKAFGITFPNPVGCAAGLDKNGEHIDALMALGFGFVEIGTVTPRPQEGNPKPRMFRLKDEMGIINRLGFNNHGVDALVKNVERSKREGILGINIGKNKDTPNERAIDDYLHCLERVYDYADYITVNISSPNTQGLRDLQGEEALRVFVNELRAAQEDLAAVRGHRVPMLVKIAPDLSEAEIEGIAGVFNAAKLDGVIAGNTTIDRSMLGPNPIAGQVGGLSGKPLYEKATNTLRRLRLHLDNTIPIIGVGGITEGADALGKVSAGASLVQIYTGFIYRGPELIGECVNAMRRRRLGAG